MRWAKSGRAESKLTLFLYQLITTTNVRKVERALDFAEIASKDKTKSVVLANGWTAGMAAEIAAKLTTPAEETRPPAAPEPMGSPAAPVKKRGRHFGDCPCAKCVERRKAKT